MFLQKIFEKKCNFVRFDVSLHTILGPPRQVPSHAICGHTQVRFLASYSILYRGSLRSVYSHRIWGPHQISFFTYYGGLLIPFFVLYEGPSDDFFAYYIGAPRSLSSLTIWSPSDQFLLIQYGGPFQISFIVYYMWPSPSDQFLCML